MSGMITTVPVSAEEKKLEVIHALVGLVGTISEVVKDPNTITKLADAAASGISKVTAEKEAYLSLVAEGEEAARKIAEYEKIKDEHLQSVHEFGQHIDAKLKQVDEYKNRIEAEHGERYNDIMARESALSEREAEVARHESRLSDIKTGLEEQAHDIALRLDAVIAREKALEEIKAKL